MNCLDKKEDQVPEDLSLAHSALLKKYGGASVIIFLQKENDEQLHVTLSDQEPVGAIRNAMGFLQELLVAHEDGASGEIH